MTYIKRLKLKGFKSFLKPTTLIFESNFNSIIGANGSGKSNIFDALCFVLGRLSSKSLRAEKLGNLVFNGGKNHKPAKQAEVELFLDNSKREFLDSEVDEVKISRVVKQDGSSKYYFNNRVVTRTDILIILRRINIDPDGYNIILQGDIQRIVNMSNVERRILIEEIANISVYEEKREKSLKKLEQIEGQLKEADLLLDEKTKYIRELKSEKELAEKYYDTKNDFLFNNTLLIKSKIVKNNLLSKKKKESLEKNEKNLEKVESELEKLENESNRYEKLIEEFEKKIELESHKDFVDISREISDLENEIKNSKDRYNEIKKNIKEMKDKKEEIQINLENNKQNKKELENKIKKKDLELKEFEKKLKEANNKIDSLKNNLSNNSLDKLNEIDDGIEKLDEEIFENNKIREDYNIQIEKLNTKISHFEKELEQISKSEDKNKDLFKDLEKKRERLKKLILKISELANKDSEVASRIGNLQREYDETLEKYTRVKAKAEHAKTAISNNRAVEEVLKFKNRDDELYGTVAELGSVDEKYSLALETVGGNSLFSLVVENENTAIKYINFLKEKKIGSATFLPLTKIKKNIKLDSSVIGKDGVIDYAVNLIRFDKKFTNVFNLIYGDTLVIEDIKYAKNLGIGKYKMVSLDGDLALKSGAMSGGFRKRRNLSGSVFKDDKAIQELENIENRLSTIKDSLSHLKSEKNEIENKLYNLRQEKIELEGEIVKLEKTLEIEGKDKDSILKEIDLIKKDKKFLENELKNIINKLNELKKNKEVLSKEKLKLKDSFSKNEVIKEIEKYEEKRDELKEKYLELKGEKESISIQLNNVLIPEYNVLEKNHKNTKEYIEENKEKLVKIKEKIKEKEEKLKVLKNKEKELSKDYKGLIEERDNYKKNKKNIDEKYNKVYDNFVKIKEEISRLKLQIEEYENVNKVLEEELENLYEEVKLEFQNDEEKINNFLNKIQEGFKEEINIKALQNKVNALKAKLNSFGSINLKAVQIYDQLSEEYNELLKKREALNNDKVEIEGLISELDLKKKEIFLETFEKIRENFIKIFKELSDKGEADLVLEDRSNIFENGVQIKVKLSVKNFLDIKSLSGGEKTITALAFLFAVQEFNPASFYIFDEVDAALDSFNSEKLGELIKKYSKKAQYIVVSHSENVIKYADVIYGVTMDKNKISDVVSLKFEEINKSMIENNESENEVGV